MLFAVLKIQQSCYWSSCWCTLMNTEIWGSWDFWFNAKDWCSPGSCLFKYSASYERTELKFSLSLELLNVKHYMTYPVQELVGGSGYLHYKRKAVYSPWHILTAIYVDAIQMYIRICMYIEQSSRKWKDIRWKSSNGAVNDFTALKCKWMELDKWQRYITGFSVDLTRQNVDM